MDSPVGTTFGKYKITGLLGKGGMGEVYEAYDTDKGRTVALKILTDQYAQDEKFRTRFLRESHAAAILEEPHVIPIHDWGEIAGNLYIDMRRVQGPTLHDLIKKGLLKPERAVAIVQQVAAALDAAHAEGLIHRDVKTRSSRRGRNRLACGGQEEQAKVGVELVGRRRVEVEFDE